MRIVIPSPYKEKFVLCEQCRALYRSSITLDRIRKPGSAWCMDFVLRRCAPCPDCGFELNTCPDNTLPRFVYWIIAAWRIFWYGRIEYKEEDKAQ